MKLKTDTKALTTTAAIATPNATIPVPAVVAAAGPEVTTCFLEFFVANIRNKNTRRAYAQAVGQFLAWCEAAELGLTDISTLAVSAYIESHPGSRPTVKQHLAAIRMLFDWLVDARILPESPAAKVKGPRWQVKTGSTPVMTAEDVADLLQSIDTSHVVGLRDRALIATMAYSFARVGAVLGMNVEDYFPVGKRYRLRLHEKGGKLHEVPAHHKLEEYLDEYIRVAGIEEERKGSLFRSTRGRSRRLTVRRLRAQNALDMIKRRARDAGIKTGLCCHTFRATGITVYLENGGSLDRAQAIAAHSSIRTTQLYDRTSDKINLDEIERIRF